MPHKNNFQSLQVFENPEINKAIDSIYNLLEDNFGDVGENIKVCGSVAKMMHGELPENYQPKDIDLVVLNRYYWRFLKKNIDKIKTKETVCKDVRFILNFDLILIEIWKPLLHNHTHGTFKNKIYYCYGYKN